MSLQLSNRKPIAPIRNQAEDLNGRLPTEPMNRHWASSPQMTAGCGLDFWLARRGVRSQHQDLGGVLARPRPRVLE